jgi:hypothetical protein
VVRSCPSILDPERVPILSKSSWATRVSHVFPTSGATESFKGAAGRSNHRGGRPRGLDAVRPQRVMGRVGSLAEPFLRLRGRVLLPRSGLRYSETGRSVRGPGQSPGSRLVSRRNRSIHKERSRFTELTPGPPTLTTVHAAEREPCQGKKREGDGDADLVQGNVLAWGGDSGRLFPPWVDSEMLKKSRRGRFWDLLFMIRTHSLFRDPDHAFTNFALFSCFS